jgi:hypothetical protein
VIRFIIILAVTVALAVISYASLWHMTVGNRTADLAACKVKAIEVLRDKTTERPSYVDNCMLARGYVRHVARIRFFFTLLWFTN